MGSHSENKEKTYRFFIKHERPEEIARDPLVFYDKKNVTQYSTSKALMRIQEKITKRALEITSIAPPALVLDLGMGCGFASTFLTIHKYHPVGIDINRLFLNHYRIPELNPIEADMTRFSFRPGQFDLILSISAIQWVLAERKDAKRAGMLDRVAAVCAEVLRPEGEAIFQFYPKSDDKMHELGSAFNRTGKFTGTFIIDNPESPKKRRIFLYLKKNPIPIQE